MRTSLVLATPPLALIVGLLLGIYRCSRGPLGQVVMSHTGLTIEQMQSLAQLVTERVNVSDVIETRLAGRTGSIRVVVVKGNAARAMAKTLGGTVARITQLS